MSSADLFMTKNERVVTNISQKYQTATVKSLKTRYMTLSSYDENNEYTGFNIELRWINCEKGIAQFEKGKEGYSTTIFNMDIDDDPVVVFENEPGFEFHIFEKVADYEINQKIKEGGLYKFQDKVTNEWFLGVVYSVGAYQITLSKFDIIRDKTFNPALYTLCQNVDIFGISTTDKFCIEKFKNYTVTELLDLTTAFGDDEDDMEESKR